MYIMDFIVSEWSPTKQPELLSKRHVHLALDLSNLLVFVKFALHTLLQLGNCGQ